MDYVSAFQIMAHAKQIFYCTPQVGETVLSIGLAPFHPRVTSTRARVVNLIFSRSKHSNRSCRKKMGRVR